MKKKIVILTGAGISAESGIKTFRDSDGLWENHKIEDVATPQGFNANPELVLNFYNERRRHLLTCQPNGAHFDLVKLEQKYDLQIITQNVDDLHERAGSKKVMHLHGELRKARSVGDPSLVYKWDKDIVMGDKCERGFQLRPHIVWFNEEVPLLPAAAQLASHADIFMIIGTSLQVYPAASLMMYADPDIPYYYIDPKPQLNWEMKQMQNLTTIEEKASVGMKRVLEELM